MTNKNILLVVLLYGFIIPVCNGAVMGVYEGVCGESYVFKATLKEPGNRIGGYIEFYPKPNNPSASCGAFVVDGTLSNRAGKQFLSLDSTAWMYYSGNDPDKGKTRKRGEIKLNGPIELNGYSGVIDDLFGAIEGCDAFSFKHISHEKPGSLTLPNKDKCENRMPAKQKLDSTDEVENKYNILGLKLNMSPLEVKSILEDKGYSVQEQRKNSHLDKGYDSYTNLINASIGDNRSKTRSEMNIQFSEPFFGGGVVKIVRVLKFRSKMAYEEDFRRPTLEEINKSLLNKYGSPMKNVITTSHSGSDIARSFNYYLNKNIPDHCYNEVRRRQKRCPKMFSISVNHEKSKATETGITSVFALLYELIDRPTMLDNITRAWDIKSENERAANDRKKSDYNNKEAYIPDI